VIASIVGWVIWSVALLVLGYVLGERRARRAWYGPDRHWVFW
jgi:membrane protein DedA with SNARE-associated domain